jgi:hypothetical protein
LHPRFYPQQRQKQKKILPPLPGGMKPGDLHKFIPPQTVEGLPVPLFLSSPNAHQPARAAFGLRDKPKRFNHRNDHGVNPFGLDPSLISAILDGIRASVSG